MTLLQTVEINTNQLLKIDLSFNSITEQLISKSDLGNNGKANDCDLNSNQINALTQEALESFNGWCSK